MSEEQKVQDPAKSLKFVITIEGDIAGEKGGSINAQAFKLDEDGGVIEQAPDKDKKTESVVTALYEAGLFLQTLGLSMGLKLAIASGDVTTALGIAAAAESLGITLTGFGPGEVNETEKAEPSEEVKSLVENALKSNAA